MASVPLNTLSAAKIMSLTGFKSAADLPVSPNSSPPFYYDGKGEMVSDTATKISVWFKEQRRWAVRTHYVFRYRGERCVFRILNYSCAKQEPELPAFSVAINPSVTPPTNTHERVASALERIAIALEKLGKD